MQHITLSDEQARVVAAARQPVQVRDSTGKTLGVIAPLLWTQEDIAQAKQVLAANEPGRTTEEVLKRLHALGQQ